MIYPTENDFSSKIHLKELSVKLKRLVPGMIEQDLKLSARDLAELEIEAGDVKEETEEDAVAVEELLSDEEQCQAETRSATSPPVKVFECPLCPRERTTLNR